MTSRLIRFREINDLYYKDHTKPTNTFCGQNAVIFVTEVGGTTEMLFSLFITVYAFEVSLQFYSVIAIIFLLVPNAHAYRQDCSSCTVVDYWRFLE
jgi:hypothetical protein